MIAHHAVVTACAIARPQRTHQRVEKVSYAIPSCGGVQPMARISRCLPQPHLCAGLLPGLCEFHGTAGVEPRHCMASCAAKKDPIMPYRFDAVLFDLLTALL